jgi:SAM-dependent methyltransferase
VKDDSTAVEGRRLHANAHTYRNGCRAPKRIVILLRSWAKTWNGICNLLPKEDWWCDDRKMSGEAGYFAAQAEALDEVARLRLIEAECDPHTFRYLDAISVGEGWRCLEVGAGAGSVVRWLSNRVGPTGQVIAADIDPKFLLGDLCEPNVEVRRCDITCDDLEPCFYDLIHSRNLLMHLGDPADVLRRMEAALRPGGWLLAEEPDLGVVEAVDPAHPRAAVFDSCFRKGADFCLAAGMFDPYFAKRLPACMRTLGLVEMGNEGIARVFHGDEPWSRMWIQTWQRVNDALIANGVLSESDAAETRRAYEDPTFAYRAQLMQSVWGRKPRSEASS